MAWPQITIIVLLALEAGIHIAKHGEQRTGTYSIFTAAINTGITAGLLYAGGFFN